MAAEALKGTILPKGEGLGFCQEERANAVL